MLAYNLRKSNLQKSDHVREILAKLDAKKQKTSSLLTNQDSPGAIPSPGGSPNNEEKSFFPNVKTARKKAQKRITTDYYKHQPHQHQNTWINRNIPHHLPSVNYTYGNNTNKLEERMQQASTIPEQQLDKERLDINLNPFGYNRKTLAFQTHKIDYVVEWPETWPFKITSFQASKKSKGFKRQSPHKATPKESQPSEPESQAEEQAPLHWTEPTSKARILAPVDHPTKQHTISNKPYLESSISKRALRKPLPKETSNRFVLRSRGTDLEFRREGHVSRSEKNVDGNFEGTQGANPQCLSRGQSPIVPEISREQVDSVPPSTPVPGEQNHKEIPQEQSSQKLEEAQPDQSKEVDDEAAEVSSSLLNDIVNQILSETKPQAI